MDLFRNETITKTVIQHLKKAFVIALAFGILIGCGTAQNIKPNPYTKSDIIELADWKYGLDLEKERLCNLYVINGIPYSENKMDSVIAKYDRSDFGYVAFLRSRTNDNTFWNNPDCEIVTVFQTKNNQTQKQKRKILNEVQEVFNERVSDLIIVDYQCAECPALLIDKDFIWNPYERKKIVNGLEVKKIKFITFIGQPLNEKAYGKAGKNGIVEITTE